MKQRQLNHGDHQAECFKFPISILADNISLTKNIGALFRLCDALGVEHLYLTGEAVLAGDAKFSKVSRCTERAVSYSLERDPVLTLKKLQQQGYTLIALELTSGSINILDFDFSTSDKICLVLGNEAKGVNDELLEIVDHCVHIPMLGMNSSMNVICAASIAVFEISRQLK
jgi:tRNA G18 (ribose-2'-O)-methylase SpoU